MAIWLTLMHDNDRGDPMPDGFVGVPPSWEAEVPDRLKIRMLEAAIESLGHGLLWTDEKPQMASDEYLEVL